MHIYHQILFRLSNTTDGKWSRSEKLLYFVTLAPEDRGHLYQNPSDETFLRDDTFLVPPVHPCHNTAGDREVCLACDEEGHHGLDVNMCELPA